MIAEGSEADFIRRHLTFKRWQMQGLQDLLRDLASSGSVEKIVIRPHPVENHDVWREWGRPLNIDVRFEGSANNWMMAADAVVHPGCTTGIEKGSSSTVLFSPTFRTPRVSSSASRRRITARLGSGPT